jgi:hypothetical protein
VACFGTVVATARRSRRSSGSRSGPP